MTQAHVVGAVNREKAFSSVLWGITPAIGAAYWRWIAFLERENGPAEPPVAVRPPCAKPLPRLARQARRTELTSRGCRRRSPGSCLGHDSAPVSPRR
jgi:hypothetical protein